MRTVQMDAALAKAETYTKGLETKLVQNRAQHRQMMVQTKQACTPKR